MDDKFITDLITQSDLNKAGELATKTANGLKLVDVARKVLGDFAALLLFSKQAKKEAEKVLTLGEAETFKGFLQQSVGQFTQSDEGKYVMQAVGSAFIFEKLKSYKNLGVAFETAFDQLYQEETVSPEPVNEDWASRALAYAGETSEDELQKMWGRILAGEVRAPGSYSLRTLEFLKTLSKSDAELFTRVARISISTFKAAYIPAQSREFGANGKWGIRFSDLLYLEEIGLLQMKEVSSQIPILTVPHSDGHVGSMVMMSYNNRMLMYIIKEDVQEVRMNAMKLTTIGFQLLRLIDTESDKEMLRDFRDKLLANTVRKEPITCFLSQHRVFVEKNEFAPLGSENKLDMINFNE